MMKIPAGRSRRDILPSKPPPWRRGFPHANTRSRRRPLRRAGAILPLPFPDAGPPQGTRRLAKKHAAPRRNPGPSVWLSPFLGRLHQPIIFPQNPSSARRKKNIFFSPGRRIFSRSACFAVPFPSVRWNFPRRQARSEAVLPPAFPFPRCPGFVR